MSYLKHSGPQFRKLHRRVLNRFPDATLVAFANLGRCVPQEGPVELLEQVLAFWRQ